MPKKTWLYECIYFVLILNFFYEGVQKLAYLDAYSFWVNHAPVIGKFGAVFQYAVPFVEIAIAVLLIMPRYRSMALVTIIAVEIVFILWVMSVYLFTGYRHWPYHALWERPTMMGKMSLGLLLSWLSFVALMLSNKLKHVKLKRQNS